MWVEESYAEVNCTASSMAYKLHHIRKMMIEIVRRKSESSCQTISGGIDIPTKLPI